MTHLYSATLKSNNSFVLSKPLNSKQTTTDTPQLSLVLEPAGEAAHPPGPAVLQVQLLVGDDIRVQGSVDNSVSSLLSSFHDQSSYQPEYLHPPHVGVEVSVDYPWVDAVHHHVALLALQHAGQVRGEHDLCCFRVSVCLLWRVDFTQLQICKVHPRPTVMSTGGHVHNPGRGLLLPCPLQHGQHQVGQEEVAQVIGC